MSKWLSCVLWLVCPLWSGQPQPSYPVAIYTQFQHQPSATVLRMIEEETENIMAPMGVNFEWRSLDESDGGQVSSQLAVVKFLGHCEPEGEAKPAVKNALGWTHVSDGTILPFCDIDCDGIRHYLQSALHSHDGANREERYGRAVGRVLAHELYHIFANTVHHGSDGVGKAVYSVSDLLSRNFQFSGREMEALRKGKPHVILAGDSTR